MARPSFLLLRLGYTHRLDCLVEACQGKVVVATNLYSPSVVRRGVQQSDSEMIHAD